MWLLELFRQYVKSQILSEQFQKSHTVGTIPKVTYCRNNSKSHILSELWLLELFRQYVTFGIVPTVCDFWNCSDSMWLLELFRQYGRNNSKSHILSEQFLKPHTVGTIPKVTYCRNNSKSHILSEQFQKLWWSYLLVDITCKYRQDVRVSILSLFKMLIFTFGIVPTVCDFWNCSDSMWLLELFRQYVAYCRNNSKSKYQHFKKRQNRYSYILTIFTCNVYQKVRSPHKMCYGLCILT
jgi:hemolysin-activating ACP:hemolysin acyltransferase